MTDVKNTPPAFIDWESEMLFALAGFPSPHSVNKFLADGGSFEAIPAHAQVITLASMLYDSEAFTPAAARQILGFIENALVRRDSRPIERALALNFISYMLDALGVEFINEIGEDHIVRAIVDGFYKSKVPAVERSAAMTAGQIIEARQQGPLKVKVAEIFAAGPKALQAALAQHLPAWHTPAPEAA